MGILRLWPDPITFMHRGLEFTIDSHFISRFRERVKKPQPDIVKTCIHALEKWKRVADEEKAARANNRLGYSNEYLYDPKTHTVITLSLDKWQNRYTIFKTIYSGNEEKWATQQAVFCRENFFGDCLI